MTATFEQIPRNAEFLDTIFTRKYYQAYDRIAEFVLHHIIKILQKLNVEPSLSNFTSTLEIINRLNLVDKSQLPLEWMFRFLTERGFLESKVIGQMQHYKIRKKLPAPNPYEISRKILEIEKGLRPSLELITFACSEYPYFFTGEKTGVEILFKGDRLKLWFEYFSNKHYLYSVFNALGAYGVSRWWNSQTGVILEVGGGTGAAAVSILNTLRETQLYARVKEYIFSDLSLILLRMGKQVITETISNKLSVIEKQLDFNKSLVAQGIEEGSVHIVYGVNALHVAEDLLFSLGQIHKVLAGGGIVVISEFARPSETATLHPEIIFNLLDDFRGVKIDPDLRPTYGFLTPRHWQFLLKKAGFENIEMMINTDSGAPYHRQTLGVVIKGQKIG